MFIEGPVWNYIYLSRQNWVSRLWWFKGVGGNVFVCLFCLFAYFVWFVIAVFLSNLYSKDRETGRGEHYHSLNVTPPNSGIVLWHHYRTRLSKGEYSLPSWMWLKLSKRGFMQHWGLALSSSVMLGYTRHSSASEGAVFKRPFLKLRFIPRQWTNIPTSKSWIYFSA